MYLRDYQVNFPNNVNRSYRHCYWQNSLNSWMQPLLLLFMLLDIFCLTGSMNGIPRFLVRVLSVIWCLSPWCCWYPLPPDQLVWSCQNIFIFHFGFFVKFPHRGLLLALLEITLNGITRKLDSSVWPPCKWVQCCFSWLKM